MALRIQIAKFKSHLYQLRANSPNSMLAKVSLYMVYKLYQLAMWAGELESRLALT